MPLFYQQDINETTKLAVWKIDEAEDFFLSKVPVSRTITHPHKRLQHLAGRFLLPYLFNDFPSQEIEIAGTRKPFLPNEQYHFSISHCGNYAAAIASSTDRVGIDVEMKTPRVEKIKSKFLNANELRFVNAQMVSKRLDILNVLWSAKEAMFKWYALGEVDFSDMMQTFPFMLNGQGEIHAAFLKGDFQEKLLVRFQHNDELSLAWVHSKA